MGHEIPRPIKRAVIRKWLEGEFRDTIAKELQISQGAVSGIVNDFKKDDKQFDLLREVAVKIKKLGMDPPSFAPLVRLYEILIGNGALNGPTGRESLEIVQNRMESLIVSMEVLCYKKNIGIEELASLVANMYSASETFSIPLDRFPAHIAELEDRISVLTREMERLEAKKIDMFVDYNITSDSLRAYEADRPLIEKIKRLKEELACAEEALTTERCLNQIGEELEWSVDECELIGINAKLCNRSYYKINGTEIMTIKLLRELVTEVFHRPSQYPESIREMMREYRSQHKDREPQHTRRLN
jgi:hypothetical protein